MATAAELIRGSLRLIGQIAEGETPSNETYADALEALNQMLDAWSTDSLMIHALQDQSFTWAGNTVTRTIGPTGNFVGTRPVRVHDASHFIVDGLSYPLFIITQDQYESFPDKTSTGTYPMWLAVNPTMPNTTLTVYPIHTTSIEIHVVSEVELTQPAALATSLSIPPGYMRAFRFNLAAELAAEFGKEPPAWVLKTAMEAKGAISAVNSPLDVLRFPVAIPSGASGGYDIYSG